MHVLLRNRLGSSPARPAKISGYAKFCKVRNSEYGWRTAPMVGRDSWSRCQARTPAQAEYATGSSSETTGRTRPATQAISTSGGCPQAEALVEDRSQARSDQRAQPVDPVCLPHASDEGRSERTCRVHGSPGQWTSPQGGESDGPAEGEGGKLADGPGVGGDRDDDEHQDGGEQDLDAKRLERAPCRHRGPEACLPAGELPEHPGRRAA